MLFFILHNDYQITLKTRKTLFPNLKVPYLGSYVSLTQWFRSELASNEDQTWYSLGNDVVTKKKNRPEHAYS